MAPPTLLHLDQIWTGLRRGAIVAAAVVVGWVVFHDLFGGTLKIEPVNLPKTLTRAGLSPEIVATRLQTQLVAYAKGSASTMHAPGISIDGGTSSATDVAVPGTGLSIGGLTAWIDSRVLTPGVRAFWHLPLQQRVVGEIVETEAETYVLYLRLNGEVLPLTSARFTKDGFDAAIAGASVDLARQVMPYTYASYLYRTGTVDRAEIESLLNDIISMHLVTDETVVRAHNLLGSLLEDRGDFVDAMIEFERANIEAEAVRLRDFSVAYYNMAIMELQFAEVNPIPSDRDALLARAYTFAVMARTRSPDIGDIYYLLGRIYTAVPDDVAAQQNYDIAKSLPMLWNDAELYESRADLHVRHGDYGAAVSDQKVYLRRLQNRNPQVKPALLAAQYLRLVDLLLHEEAGNPDAVAVAPDYLADIDDVLRAAAGAGGIELGIIASAQAARVPDGPSITSPGTLAHAVVLEEACAALVTVSRLQASGNDVALGKSQIDARLTQINQRRAGLIPLVPPCELPTDP